MMLDVGNYRAGLRKQLTAQGDAAVEEVRRTGESFSLPPDDPVRTQSGARRCRRRRTCQRVQRRGTQPVRGGSPSLTFHVEQLWRYGTCCPAPAWNGAHRSAGSGPDGTAIDNNLAVTEDHECLPEAATVIDVGSGAGLPGSCGRSPGPICVICLEPLERRTRFLHKAVDDLGLRNVQVERGRAPDSSLYRGSGDRQGGGPYRGTTAVAGSHGDRRWAACCC